MIKVLCDICEQPITTSNKGTLITYKNDKKRINEFCSDCSDTVLALIQGYRKKEIEFDVKKFYYEFIHKSPAKKFTRYKFSKETVRRVLILYYLKTSPAMIAKKVKLDYNSIEKIIKDKSCTETMKLWYNLDYTDDANLRQATKACSLYAVGWSLDSISDDCNMSKESIEEALIEFTGYY